MNNIFEKASRDAIRFTSNKGELSTEQLWQLPLQAANGFDLDHVARTVNNALKASSEESFVSTVSNPLKDGLELKLEIVKHIIAVRKEENSFRLAAAATAEKRRKLMDLLGKKQDAALEGLSEDEIKKQLADLG
jgi:hypothetical protein